MPRLYEISCSECGHARGPMASSGWALLKPNGELATLGHPLEAGALLMQGYSLSGAVLRGRLINDRRAICRNCGGIYHSRRFGCPPCPGCGVGLSTALLVGIGVGVKTGAIWWGLAAGMAGGMAGLILFPLGAIPVCRLAAALFGRSAPDVTCCDAPEPVLLDAAAEQPFPCKMCGRTSVSVCCVGMS